MIRRIIPLALFTFITAFTFAQIPQSIDIGSSNATQNTASFVACPPGASPDAGTSTQTLFPSAQSNDVLFLCLGDSMDVRHFGGDLSGDPQTDSPAGFSYVFYDCAPTNTGPTAMDILDDLCHRDIIPGDVTAIQTNIDIDGNATFFNQGQVQAVLNGGNPMTVFFAPITLDDFGSFGFEQDGSGVNGPCINVNTTDAFTVTYLNAIQGNNINQAANGNCVGSFNVAGGLPELDGSNYTNISITLSSDPSVEADISGANFTHNDLIEFTVPRAGIYDVIIEDDKSCAAIFTINMTGCEDVIFDASEEFGNPNDVVCVQVDVNDFTNILSFQYTINWDPTVIQLQSTAPNPLSVNNLGALADINFGPAAPIDALTISWFDGDFSGESLPNGTGIFEICFTIIGAPGTSSPITFSGDLTQVEVLGPDPNGILFPPLGFDGQAGMVTVAGDIVLNFTSCSSLSSAPTDVGSFTVNASGGIPPYTFSWENTANGAFSGTDGIFNSGGAAIIGDNVPASDTPLPPGTYQITLTDNNGDQQIASVEIFDEAPLVVSIGGTDPTCADTPDGTMFINSNNLPLAGVAPHTIVWSTMDMGVTSINNLLPDIYSVTVTDAAGCTKFDQAQINADPIIVDTLNLQHVSCNGPGNDGLIIIDASGGSGGGYDYRWDNGRLGPNIDNLIPGTYCVSITDGNNCEIVHCIDINAPMPPVVVNWDSTSVSCPADIDGSLTVNAIAGNSPIDSYTWDPAQPGSDETISGIGSGTYYVTITAQDGCTTRDSATLFAPSPMVLDSFIAESPSCPGAVNGAATPFVSGGTGPYTYAWSTGFTQNFARLPGLNGDSLYIVTITDSGNCGNILIDSIFVEDPPAIEVAFTGLQRVTCNGGIPCDGQAIAIASGGTALTGEYNFNWQESGESFSGVSQSMATQLCQGVVTLEVNDGLCSVTVDTFIEAPPAIQIDLAATEVNQVSCFDAIDGSATIQVTGGAPGYTYQWTNPNVSGPSIDNLPAGTYTGIATDADGCTFQYDVNIMEPLLLEAMISGQMDADCSGSADGMLEVSWVGGNPGNATYAWTDNVSTTSIAENLTAGVYTVTVTDEKGCNTITTGVVDEPAPVFFELDSILSPPCFGFQTLVSVDTAFGGIGGPYSFSIGGATDPVPDGTIPALAGNYTVVVFDGDGCPSEGLDIEITQPDQVRANLGDDIPIDLGDSTLLDAQPYSSLGVDSVIWSPALDVTCADPTDTLCQEVWVQPLDNTVYTVLVVDENGCTGTDQVLVEVDKDRKVFIPNIFSPNDDGVNDLFSVFIGNGVTRVVSMKLFDRWGELVYNQEDFVPDDLGTQGWDGFFKGKPMNTGVFIYLIEVEFADGIVLLYRGDFTLMH